VDAKQCTKCGEAKSLAMFYKALTRPDGHLAQCKNCVKRQQQQYKDANRDRISAYQNQRYQKNRAEILKRNETWRLANMAKQVARVTRYKQRRRNAAPHWLTGEDNARILAKYKEATWMTASSGIKHHVDHIVPLQGKTVCGLHVPWNLRVIPARENQKKFNRLQS